MADAEALAQGLDARCGGVVLQQVIDPLTQLVRLHADHHDFRAHVIYKCLEAELRGLVDQVVRLYWFWCCLAALAPSEKDSDHKG